MSVSGGKRRLVEDKSGPGSLSCQPRQLLRAFGDAFSDIDHRIEITGFLPQLPGLLRVADLGLQYCHAADGVSQVQRRSIGLDAIEIERFAVARLGQLRVSNVPIQVTEMTYGVGEREWVSIGSGEFNRFLIVLPCRKLLVELSLYLAQQAKGLRQISTGNAAAQ